MTESTETTATTSTTTTSTTAAATAATIGLRHGVALYVCAILGAGVLVLPGQAASLAGPASLIAWAFSAILGVPLAFTFAALASRFPDAGGVAAFAARAFGPAAGGIAGWWYFVAGSVGQTIVPLTAGYYVAEATGVGPPAAVLIALALLGIAVAVNLAGMRLSGRTQLVLAAAVMLFLLVVIATAIPQIDAARFVPFAPHGIGGVGSAVLVLFFAFAGWEAITHLAGEFSDVRRNLPRATMITACIVLALYVGVALAVVGTGTYGTPEVDRVALGAIIATASGWSSGVVVAVAAVLICLGTCNAFVASISRLGFALGRDGWAPARLAGIGRRGVPSAAILTVGLIGAIGLAVAGIAGLGTAEIVYIPSTLVLTTYLIGTAAGVRLLSGPTRLVPAVALVALVCVTPFAGWHLVVPAGVAVAAMLYRWLAVRRGPSGGHQDPPGARRRSRRSDRRPTVSAAGQGGIAPQAAASRRHRCYRSPTAG